MLLMFVADRSVEASSFDENVDGCQIDDGEPTLLFFHTKTAISNGKVAMMLHSVGNGEHQKEWLVRWNS